MRDFYAFRRPVASGHKRELNDFERVWLVGRLGNVGMNGGENQQALVCRCWFFLEVREGS